MTIEMLEKANEIQNELTKLRKECKRIPRQYLDWKDETRGYWKRMLASIGRKIFIKFPPRYESDTDILLELSKEDLQCLVEIREKRIKVLESELDNFSIGEWRLNEKTNNSTSI